MRPALRPIVLDIKFKLSSLMQIYSKQLANLQTQSDPACRKHPLIIISGICIKNKAKK